jgi:DNA-binding response OmpR family regulator
MPRLLLVESDPYMQRTFQKLFATEEYFCAVAPTAEDAHKELVGDAFDLVILHLGQAPAEGLALLRQIRTRHHTPVLVLAPQHDVADTVLGFEAGADDYLCEPFDPRELRARVQAQLRRADGYSRPVSHNGRFDLGGIVLDVAQRDAFRGDEALKLTSREFELLHFLAKHRGQPLASHWIFENVWGCTADLGLKALKVYVSRLRRKIETDSEHPLLLINVRGFGYKLVA